MFGVVPKSLWQRTNPADSNNMIDLAARCLLIEDGDRLILIDNGMGNKQSEKFFGYYSLWGDHDLEKSLAELEALVDDLESGDLPLEKAMKKFEDGIKLTRSCQTALKEAEQKVQILLESAAGDTLEPFDPDDD